MPRKKDVDVSVVMCVYNAIPYLSDSIRSILDQSIDSFEFIIINDGSNDGSAKVLDRFEDKDDRVRVIHQSNRGISASRNRGLRLARGDYVAVMDADDIAFPTRLERQVSFLEANPHVGIVGTQVQRISSEGVPIGRWCFPTDSDSIAWRLLFRTSLCHPTIMARRSLLEKLSGYSKWATVAHDYELFTRAVLHTQVTNLPDTLLKYRSHKCSISKRKNSTLRREVKKSALQLHNKILQDNANKTMTHFLSDISIGGRFNKNINNHDCTNIDVKCRMAIEYIKELYKNFRLHLCNRITPLSAKRNMTILADNLIEKAYRKNKKKIILQKLKARAAGPISEFVIWVLDYAKRKFIL